MKKAIIFDCEFLCLEGSQRRFWCAAHDPDPVIAQIGAVRLGLEGDFPLSVSYTLQLLLRGGKLRPEVFGV
ncbi:hypothetical protein SAMN03159288_03864 [Rhizobium sp. NFACC06-2]|nr:hypothetical protein SAMN03159288_03864 [Rhizobium sp. NFACC06-2]